MFWIRKKPSLLARIRKKFLFYFFCLLGLVFLYYHYWGSHLYKVTAYCNCPICINVKEFQDGRFANGDKVHWGGIAADKKVPFGTEVELEPFNPADWLAVHSLLHGRRQFVVTDRGGKIKGKHIDLFIPKSKGGHEAAKKWGVRYMRLKINEEWAE